MARTSRSKIRDPRLWSFALSANGRRLRSDVVLRLFFASFSTSNAGTVLHLVLALSAAADSRGATRRTRRPARAASRWRSVTDLENHPLVDVRRGRLRHPGRRRRPRDPLGAAGRLPDHRAARHRQRAARRFPADAQGGRALHQTHRPAADGARHVRQLAEAADDLRRRAARR